MCEALSNSLDIKFGLAKSLQLAMENETPMKAKKQASEETAFNDDDELEHPGPQ